MIVFIHESPISIAVVSQDAFILAREFFIIRYGVEKKCTTLHTTIRKKVFWTGVPEKLKRKARPITIPGMVFVTRAIPSITFFSFLLTVLLAVTKALP